MPILLGFGGLGMPELVVILLIAILIFGAAKIPEIARALGKAGREFKKAGKEVADEVNSVAKDEANTKDDSKDA